MSKIEIMNSEMNKIDNDDVKEAYISGSEDYLIPLVFPDYLIRLEGGSAATSNKYLGTERVPYLGHAGVLIINGQNGKTKYYEYGRYPPGDLGRTRSVPINNVKITPKKMITITSLKQVLRKISASSGQEGRIEGGILRSDNIYDKAVEYCEKKIKENDDFNRKPYSIYSNSCVTFVRELTVYLGFYAPTIVSYTSLAGYFGSRVPTLYMQQFQLIITVRDLFYNYKTNELEVNF